MEGFPPPSCPLSPTTQVARAPPGPVRVQATRAPRGHLPGRLSVLWGGSQRPGGKGAGWGGAAEEDRAGQMAGVPRDTSRSLATPPRLSWAICAGAAGLISGSQAESRVCPTPTSVYFSRAVLFFELTVHFDFGHTGPFLGFSFLPSYVITTVHRLKTYRIRSRNVCDNLSRKHLGPSQACFKCHVPGLE